MPTPLDLEKQPAGGPANKPASGTYGEKAALAGLQASLPSSAAGPPPQAPQLPPVSQQPVRPTPSAPEGRPPTGAAAPPGVPSVVLSPTDRPQVPVSSPLEQGAAQAPMSSPLRRLEILDLLAEHPEVSESTRDWARMVRRLLIGG